MKKIHFIGVNGTGMSPLASILKSCGHIVSGSDLKITNVTRKLMETGIRFHLLHNPKNVRDADFVVRTSAIKDDNCEIVKARELGIPIIHRSEIIKHLTKKMNSICISGTHGKTTTTAMISYIIEEVGLNPTFAVGGVIKGIGSNCKYGNGKFGVFETCEADKTFLKSSTDYGVITNIDDDHLEFYNNDFEQIKNAFFKFAKNINSNGILVTTIDNPYLHQIVTHSNCSIITVGIEKSDCYLEPYYKAKILNIGVGGSLIQIYRSNKYLGEVKLSVPGEHNIINSLFAVAICESIGISFSKISHQLSRFQGVDKRFDIINNGEILVIEDNAHHPTALKAALSTAKLYNRNLVVIFQPQRLSRLHYHFKQFADILIGEKNVFLFEAYSPTDEIYQTNKTTSQLYEYIKFRTNGNVRYFNDKGRAQSFIKSFLKAGDLVLSIGIAGETGEIIRDIAKNYGRRDKHEL